MDSMVKIKNAIEVPTDVTLQTVDILAIKGFLEGCSEIALVVHDDKTVRFEMITERQLG